MSTRRPPRRPTRYTTQIGIKFTPELRAAIEQVADAHNLSLADVTRRAIELGIPRLNAALTRARNAATERS